MLQNLEFITVAFDIVQVVFAFAFGACIGSLVNVLVYRLPLGLSVVTPPSRCPSCSTQLTWRENIPVLGWVMLGGKCRFCKNPISPEYPLVEAFVGILFALLFYLFYIMPRHMVVAGIDFSGVSPEWAANGFLQTWAPFVVLLVLMSCLVAMTLVDAKTFTIPLVLAWVPAGLALVFHPLWAAYISLSGRNWIWLAPHEVWAISTPGPRGWWWIGASLGGMVGLVIANVLLEKGLIQRSFADYEAWEKQAKAEMEAKKGAEIEGSAPDAATAGDPADMWIQYPHARREMGKEIVFLAPVVVLGFVGATLAHRLAAPWVFDTATFSNRPAVEAPLWLVVLAAVCMGYLIGGGIVWGFRILGSLAFGKEAIGLGDVHLLAAVGACLGWADAGLAFFLSAFVGVFLAVLRRVFSGAFRHAMPFGPSLAIATLLVVLFKPLIEHGLSAMLRTPINLP